MSEFEAKDPKKEFSDTAPAPAPAAVPAPAATEEDTTAAMEIKESDPPEVEEGPFVNLITQDGDNFTVPRKVVEISELIRTMIDESLDEDAEPQEIPLPNMKSNVLAKVIEFCKHYAVEKMAKIPEPIKYGLQVADVVQDWYGEFVDKLDKNHEYEMLFELILAANYLDIKPLLDITCATVGLMIMNKTPDQIRERFDIEEEFTPELYNQLLQENKWSTEPPVERPKPGEKKLIFS
mmetsp:Transcript_38084/g.50187  ORF Transcript_38084/g.50187 Transcript_38084/m.50187 type:complete len:236 (+) Transcript_38084:120-827(+)|eukprot:CAMPEP_0117746768 /NCGR_PEP_ID=MMETSP0947-20121206/8134_1 /TAXON_ID=44440 /ORGANISM="Chattonella subsalsa, Strain CCMP2191" /LENGTH=235 /DNA_ID=CAMNT_0005564137 /DNA_START=103 /DNA_END=810 /DNA_ORIENTATION=-